MCVVFRMQNYLKINSFYFLHWFFKFVRYFDSIGTNRHQTSKFGLMSQFDEKFIWSNFFLLLEINSFDGDNQTLEV